MNTVTRLPLEKAYNVRELGGYAINKKEVTKFHRFLRGDDLSQLTSSDLQYLKDYGVNVILDLRSETERFLQPDATLNLPEIETIQIPFMSGDIDGITKTISQGCTFQLKDLYIELLKNTERVANVVKHVADAKEGCLLFHCSAGKDRTGILSMLLLSLVGVSQEDILANYQVSYTYIKANQTLVNGLPEGMDMSCTYSEAENMSHCLDYIKTKYGDTRTYLLECGVSEKQLNRLKYRLISD